ncbi:MAG: flavin reductase family protein [Promethearchaeota archaeon]|nr:MAG: flavin reductase family protein [Candidatus Lokiarchaeota archaeon]
MEKVELPPNITAFPMPAAVISVGTGESANLITLAYVGKVCLNPPIIAISIQPKRHSYKLIEAHGEFIINYPSTQQLKETDYCGTRSGRDVNKWKKLNLTKEMASIVKVPMIKEFPLNMECKVVKRLDLGSHICYFGEVVATHCSLEYISANNINPSKLDTFIYFSGKYIPLTSKIIGRHGFSVG